MFYVVKKINELFKNKLLFIKVIFKNIYIKKKRLKIFQFHKYTFVYKKFKNCFLELF